MTINLNRQRLIQRKRLLMRKYYLGMVVSITLTLHAGLACSEFTFQKPKWIEEMDYWYGVTNYYGIRELQPSDPDITSTASMIFVFGEFPFTYLYPKVISVTDVPTSTCPGGKLYYLTYSLGVDTFRDGFLTSWGWVTNDGIGSYMVGDDYVINKGTKYYYMRFISVDHAFGRTYQIHNVIYEENIYACDPLGETRSSNNWIRGNDLGTVDFTLRFDYKSKDADNDGYPDKTADGTVVDCDDNDASTYPGAPEICGDNKDNNCNGITDESCRRNRCLDVGL